MYKYFVSYTIPNGSGRCEIVRDSEIKSIEDIFGIEKSISEINNDIKVSVMNFILMDSQFE